MKGKLLKLMLASAAVFCMSYGVSAQVYVKVRPVMPVVVQTTRPSPAHVWIGEEWNEDGNGYKYSGGHWEAPPHEGYRWYPGHWSHDNSHGDRWVKGSWRGKGGH